MVSTAPEELRAELLAKRLATPGAIPTNLLASAGLNLPNRAIVSTHALGAGGWRACCCWLGLWLRLGGGGHAAVFRTPGRHCWFFV